MRNLKFLKQKVQFFVKFTALFIMCMFFSVQVNFGTIEIVGAEEFTNSSKLVYQNKVIVSDDSKSKDNVIDLSNENDDSVTFEVARYVNSVKDGVLDLHNYSIVSDSNDYLLINNSISLVIIGESGTTSFQVTGVKATGEDGENIYIYNSDKELVATVNIKVIGSKNIISNKVNKLTLDTSAITVNVGEYKTFKVYAAYENDLTNKVDVTDNVTYKSTNEAIAKVDKGKIMGVKAGKIVIICKYQSKIAILRVTVLKDNNITINDYELTNNSLGVVQNSNILVVGESAKITSLKINMVGSSSNINSGYIVTSSDTNVVSVSNDDALKACGEGTAVITIKYGNSIKTFELSVKPNKRQASSVQVNSASNDKVLYDKEALVIVDIFDQYGDPVTSNEDKISVVGTAAIFGDSFSNGKSIDIDSEGKVALSWTVPGKQGVGILTFSNKNGDNIGTISINSLGYNEMVPSGDNYKVQIAADSESDDRTIDLLNAGDDSITFEYVKYVDGVRTGVTDLGGCTIVNDSNDYLSVNDSNSNKITFENGVKYFKVSGVKSTGDKGKNLYLFDNNQKQIAKINIKVVGNSRNCIKYINWRLSQKVTSSNEQINIYDLLTITEVPSGDDLIPSSNIYLDGSISEKVRLEDNKNTLYLDTNDDGERDNDEWVIGYLHVKAAPNSRFANSLSDDIYKGYTTVSRDSGTIVFYINGVNDDGTEDTEMIVATSPVILAIDVN